MTSNECPYDLIVTRVIRKNMKLIHEINKVKISRFCVYNIFCSHISAWKPTW